MKTIKEMMFIFGIDTLVMLVAWAGLSVIIIGARLILSTDAPLPKIISLHSFLVVLMCYAYYLVFDLFEYFHHKRTEMI